MSRKNSKSKKGGADRVVAQNALKTLFANMRFASVDEPVQTVVVTSAVQGEGKSTIAYELAKTIAQSGKYVLLVECDMHHRTQAGRLRLHASAGLYAVLAGQRRLEDVVMQTSTTGLQFLDAEPHIPNPADILASRRFGQFVRQLKGSYDYVIFDTPPISAVVDAAVVSSVADATLLVVGQNYVRRDAVVSAYEQLEKAGANVVGVVLNRCGDDPGDYYYYDYYGSDDSGSDEKGAAADGKDEERIPAMNEVPLRPMATHAAASRAGGSRPAGSRSASAKDRVVKPVAAPPAASPDTTAQFLVDTGYTPRDYEE